MSDGYGTTDQFIEKQIVMEEEADALIEDEESDTPTDEGPEDEGSDLPAG